MNLCCIRINIYAKVALGKELRISRRLRKVVAIYKTMKVVLSKN